MLFFHTGSGSHSFVYPIQLLFHHGRAILTFFKVLRTWKVQRVTSFPRTSARNWLTIQIVPFGNSNVNYFPPELLLSGAYWETGIRSASNMVEYSCRSSPARPYDPLVDRRVGRGTKSEFEPGAGQMKARNLAQRLFLRSPMPIFAAAGMRSEPPRATPAPGKCPRQ
jgi:hypothetical protein